MEKPIIIFCGLMGSGKTTLSKFFLEKMPNYERFNTDEVRRILGKTSFDRKDTPIVNEYMYSRARNLIESGNGIMFDSAYKLKEAREKIYEIGREFNIPILIIVCFCSQETVIKRISSREKKDDLHNPTNDPNVYLEYAKIWEPPFLDLEEPKNDHLSLIRINTELNKLEIIKISEKGYNSIKEIIDFIDNNLDNLKINNR